MDPVPELLRAVRAHPGDDDRRRVLADALLERGEAWGELIARQLRGEAVEAELLAAAAPVAFGALWPWVAPGSYRFARGLPRECRLTRVEERDRAEVLDAPAWATLERVTFDDEGTAGRPRHGASLVAVRGLDARGVEAFASAPLLSVGVRPAVAASPTLVAMSRGPTAVVEGLDEDLPLPGGHGFRTVALRRARDRPHTTAELLHGMPSSVERVVLSKVRDLLPPPQSWLSFTREGDGWRLHVKTYGADGVRMVMHGELSGITLVAARFDLVGDAAARSAQFERLRPWMVLPERAPCPFTLWHVPREAPSGVAWHAAAAPVHPPWLVGPDEETAHRAFP